MDKLLRYSNDIKQQYEYARFGIYADYLNNPSAGKLHNLCLLKFDSNLRESDRQVFAVFFQVPAENLNRKVIERFEIGRFRTIEYFFKGRNKTTSSQNLNLIAVLLDFEPRPFAKYMRSEKTLTPKPTIYTPADKTKQEQEPIEIDQDKQQDQQPEASPFFVVPVDSFANTFIGRFFSPSKVNIFASALIGLTFTTAVGYSLLSSNPTCMTWQNDRYIPVACKADSTDNGRDIEPFVKKKAALRLVSVDSHTICFKNEQPQLWYIKRDGDIYFFNQPGKDPVSGKKLRPVSRHICEKYILQLPMAGN